MNHDSGQPIGLIAGAGDIPVYFARKAKERGIPLISVSFTEAIGETLKPYVEQNFCISPVKAGKIFSTLETTHVRDVLILGKVEKEMIFRPQLFDLFSLKFVMSLTTSQDKDILTRIIEEVEKRGYTVLDQMDFMKELYPSAGVLTRTKPTKKTLADIEAGFAIAKYMADQEIGQTLVMKGGTVIAVEAVEGTDRALGRGCELSQGECTAIKVSRTDQDYRFDSPGIGPKTVETLIAGNAAALAIEAGRVMVIEREKVIDMADAAGLVIVSVDPPAPPSGSTQSPDAA
ncbi:LpxI family protein [Nitrospina gracilis]|uniref:LpxI family protein n=1 Tax=Nitrospina gracilis TaxID=35801 RepID=UPI001F1DA66A|nr:UDP-2,3-diacylglucosamine diphosphatase LpxI [Nitrospina gracilis]MCF8719544.1 DUF1009 family protein [Nitrospina gracilis Nb-211]